MSNPCCLQCCQEHLPAPHKPFTSIPKRSLQNPSPTPFNQTLTLVLNLCADLPDFRINGLTCWGVTSSWCLGSGSAWGLQRSRDIPASQLPWLPDKQLYVICPNTSLLQSSNGVCKGGGSRCDGNLGLCSLWTTWIVGIGWIFTYPGRSSVAVGQQKSSAMDLQAILSGSCQKSHHATQLFSWCFACWKHCVCLGVSLTCVPVSEHLRVLGCPCKVPVCRVPRNRRGDAHFFSTGK